MLTVILFFAIGNLIVAASCNIAYFRMRRQIRELDGDIDELSDLHDVLDHELGELCATVDELDEDVTLICNEVFDTPVIAAPEAEPELAEPEVAPDLPRRLHLVRRWEPVD